MFRIRWKGWAAKDDTWQEEDDLNCSAILKKYKSTMKAVASPVRKAMAAGSPKKRGRPSLASLKAAATSSGRKSLAGSPKKKAKKTGGVAQGKVTKTGRGRPRKSLTSAGKRGPAKKAAKPGKKRGRKPKSEVEWEVEEVVAVRTTEAGTEEFYIKWKGYSSEENTWEPADNVGNCDKAVERFRKAQDGEDVDGPTENGAAGDAEEEEVAANGEDTEDGDAVEEEEEDKNLSKVSSTGDYEAATADDDGSMDD